MIHICQAEIEMIALAASVIRNPFYSKTISHAIRCTMKQLIKEVINVRGQTKVTEVNYAPSVQR